MNEKYLRPKDIDFCLAHVVEEAGEVLQAAGKVQRWGWWSTNPELPPSRRETNIVWLKRELEDLKVAIARLEACEEMQ